jgi:hypothetical protein
VDVYVNYLRKKVDFPQDEKLIHTIRGEGYRLGKPASPLQAVAGDDPTGLVRSLSIHSYPSSASAELRSDVVAQADLPGMVHSVAHDLAQPLTSIRCFLEVLALDKNLPSYHASDLRVIEQQTDRAIALTKGISALVREFILPTEPWVPLDQLWNEVLNDFSVLINSGMLMVERQWDAPIWVTSSPILRQILVVLVSKLAGRNTRPLLLTVYVRIQDGRCGIRFAWKTTDSRHSISDARTVLAKDIPLLQRLVESLDGELSVPENETEVHVVLPAAPNTVAARGDLVQ